MGKQNRTWLRVAILAVLLAALVFAVYSSFKKETGTVQVGDTAPNFSLQQLDGAQVKLSDLRGKAVVLNFWGSWCVPCKTEMPDLEKQYQLHKNDGVVFTGVNIGESPITAKQFISQVGVTFPIWLDQQREITRLYNIGPIPTTFFIDKNGIVKDVFIGQMNEQILQEKVAKILQ
ncbi:thiol-disulfide oxidoreductase ResA [Brevibacillus sp. SYSU BS000544]|uniref:thiol-disulfide oxidoreductase ResA n=1 Tax=Brevibacillus sp. SYSU BS000544 TaxID=3416443 RepID=UPI003CE4610A